VQVRGPLNPSDVVTSSVDIHVIDDDCVLLCHSDGGRSTQVTFVVAALSSYHLSDVVVDFGDEVTSSVQAGDEDDLASVPYWAAECYRRAAETAVLRHQYAGLGRSVCRRQS